MSFENPFAVVAFVTLVLAAIPAVMTLINLAIYRAPRAGRREHGRREHGRRKHGRRKHGRREPRPAVSVLIPARDEERSIAASVMAALASRGVDLEVIVLDDHSTDATAAIVRDIAARDSRVRLADAPELPAGWNGKQHACHALSKLASHPILAFVDADVRLAPNGLRRAAAFLDRSDADLVSGIPRQVTGTWSEKLVIPVIHFILLGFLPMLGMRFSRQPGFAAGCGQLFVARREPYIAVGGHATIKDSRHDGVKLPRAFRQAGYKTDLFDATPIATCRMYTGLQELWPGFAKNADEGMATPAAIGPWTLLLFGGQVVPILLLAIAWLTGAGQALTFAAVAVALAYGTRFVLTLCFRQSWLGAALHPIGVAMVVAIQWFALWEAFRGREIAWKGRGSDTGEEPAWEVATRGVVLTERDAS